MLLHTPVCDFGWKAPDFTLKDPDGKSYTMEGSMGEKGLLIAFICNHCPYVKAIIEQLVTDVNSLSNDGIATLAVMSNDYHYVAEDSPPAMKEFAAMHNMSFPYLIDEDQSVGKAYGAVCTPDFFGFNAKGELQYRGRLDSVGMNDEAADRIPELLIAMHQIAKTGIGPESQTPSMGCSIKWF